MKLLEGKVALITGASRGIGRAVAEAFLHHGAQVVLTSRGDQIEALAQKHGDAAMAVRGDLKEEAFAAELARRAKQRFGRVDVLVNNAGVLQQALLGMIPRQAVAELFAVNAIAPMSLTQYAIRLMEPGRGASIVNVASIAGTRGLEAAAAYSASKGALVGFTLACAKELAPKGIRVNAVAPGVVDTELLAGVSPEWRQKRIDAIGLGRPGRAEEVANAVVFLASDLASYVTGQVLGVDGGMVA